MNLSVNKDEKTRLRAESRSTERKTALNNTLQDRLKNKVKENVKNKLTIPKFGKKNLDTTTQEDTSLNNIKIINKKPTQEKSQLDSKQKPHSKQNLSQSIETHSDNPNKIEKPQQQAALKKNNYVDHDNERLVTSQNVDQNLRSKIGQVISYINGLKRESLNENADKLIKDFLIHVKKATVDKKGDDLCSRFIVMIHILEKFFERMDCLSDNIIFQSAKIIIVSPCFLNDKLHHFEEIIEKLRKAVNNQEKFFSIIIAVLDKFNTTTNSSTFLKNIDPKYSFIAVFNYFIKNKFEDIVLQTLKGIIERCLFLSQQEKIDYYNKIDLIVNSSEEKEKDDEYFESNEEDSPPKQVGNLESSIMKERININTYQQHFRERSKEQDLEEDKGSIDEEDQQNQQEMTHEELSNDKFPEQKEDISMIKKRSHSPDAIHSDEDKIRLNLGINKNPWIEKFKEEKKTHIETLNNLEKTSKDYLVQVNENEKLNKKLQMLIKQNQQLMQGIEKFSEQKEKAIPKALEERDNIQKEIVTEQLHPYQNEISNMRSLLDEKFKSLENNYKKIEEKLEGKPQKLGETRSPTKQIATSTDINPTQSKIFKPIKSLDSIENEENFIVTNNKIPTKQDQPIQQTQVPNYTSLILKIPSMILDADYNITHYVKLESIYSKLEIEDRVSFIEQMKEVLESHELMNTANFNSLLLLFEFMVTLLTYEIKNSSRYLSSNKDHHRNMVFNVQEGIENLVKSQKNLTNVYAIQIYLLKKHLPSDFKRMMDRDSLIFIKVVSHLLKSTNETLSFSSTVNAKELLKELNDLFVKFPSSNLVAGIPNLQDLDKVYTQLKNCIDVFVPKFKLETHLFVKNVKQSGLFCPIFLQYLESIV